MYRVAVLAFLTGCQLVFDVDPLIPPSACGSFVISEELQFAGVVEVRQFSVEASGTKGFVFARRPGSSIQQELLAVKREGTMWVEDLDTMPGNRRGVGTSASLEVLFTNEGVRTARTSSDGNDLFVGFFPEGTSATQVRQYRLGPNGWTRRNPNVTKISESDLTVPGGVVVDSSDPNVVFRHVPVLHTPASGRRFVSVLRQIQANPVDIDEWIEVTNEGRNAANAINEGHEHVEQAAMAKGPNGELVIAYEASEGGDSKLFLGEKDDEEFPRGVILDELDEPGSEVEPFLSPDCQTLYFRRDEAIFRAVVEPVEAM